MNYNASLIQLLLNQCWQLWLNLLDFRQYKYAGRQWRHQRFVFCSHDWHVLLKKKKKRPDRYWESRMRYTSLGLLAWATCCPERTTSTTTFATDHVATIQTRARWLELDFDVLLTVQGFLRTELFTKISLRHGNLWSEGSYNSIKTTSFQFVGYGTHCVKVPL